MQGAIYFSAIIIYSSIAQSVEHSAVNRVVVGSSPTGGARAKLPKLQTPLFTVASGPLEVYFEKEIKSLFLCFRG